MLFNDWSIKMSGWTPGYTMISLGLIIASPVLIAGYAIYAVCTAVISGIVWINSKAFHSSENVSTQGVFKKVEINKNSSDMLAHTADQAASVARI